MRTIDLIGLCAWDDLSPSSSPVITGFYQYRTHHLYRPD
jgi:hypothetical protein